jgi:Na+/proline symporter
VTTAVSAALALGGESAYALLEGSYALSLAGPFVPLLFGLFWRRGGQSAAVVSLVLGYAITGAEQLGFGEDLVVPLPLVALAVSAAAYVIIALRTPAPAPA